MEYQCQKCNRAFRTASSLADHLNSIGHAQRPAPRSPARCPPCNKNFPSQRSLSKHLDSAIHSPNVCTQFRCCDCTRDFATERALMDHLRDKVHTAGQPAPVIKTFPCTLCDKVFRKKDALKQHKASAIHKPLCAPIACVGSRRCKKRFVSPSSMIAHLESGSCASKMTRVKLNAIIAQQDVNHLITSQAALEGTQSMESSWLSGSDEGVVLTPSSSSLSLSTTWAVSTPSERSTDSSLVEMMVPSDLFFCPSCPPTSNRFRTARDLDQHSKSPVHAPKIFHCPAALPGHKGKSKEKKMFSTLSGLSMHVETGACGKKMFQDVLGFVNDRLKEFGIREIRLLQ